MLVFPMRWLRQVPAVVSFCALAGLMAGSAAAQDEGFGGGEPPPALPSEAPDGEALSDDAGEDQEPGAPQPPSPSGQTAAPDGEKKPEPPLETNELYEPINGEPAPSPGEGGAPPRSAPPAARDEKAPAPPGGGGARVRPLMEPVDDPPPDGLGNWAASSVQYGTGVCSACGCCGTSGVLGGIALAVAIVVPGGVLLTPFVGCLGCSSVVGAPGIGVSAAVWLREWLGIWRGPWMIAVGLAYVIELLGVAALLAGVAVATAVLYGFVQSIQGPGLSSGNLLELINPPEEWAWENAGVGALLFAGSFAFGLTWAVLVPSLAATAAYQLLGEQKHHYDIGFRVPGFFGPNHADEPKVHPPDKKGPERVRPRPAPEPAAMQY